MILKNKDSSDDDKSSDSDSDKSGSDKSGSDSDKSDSEDSKSETESEEEEDDEEGKCRWDCISDKTKFLVSKNKKIVERVQGSSDNDRLVYSKQKCSKFKLKILISKGN